MPDPTVEQEALAMGWIPQDKFRGDPTKWTDAETFVKRGKELLPILRAREAKTASELAAVKAQMGEMQKALKDSSEALTALTKYHEETAQRAYEKARKDLVAEKTAELKALKDGDGDPERIVELDEAIAALDKAKPAPAPAPAPAAAPTPPAPPVHPDYPAWEAENKHWMADPEKMSYAGAMSNYIRATNPTLIGRPFLDKITEAVEEKFGSGGTPSKSVEGGGRESRRGSGGGKDYVDLPADAKAACDRLAARLVGKGKAYESVDAWRKQYVKDYDWS